MVHHGSYARLTKGHIQEIHTPHTLATHRSPILRKLKDVDMYLQHNKATNLRLAAARIDGVVIHPGQRLRCLFSDKYKTHKYSVGRAYSC